MEWGGVLLSFAIPKKISLNPKDKRLAVEVEPHPLEYANFEGVIPEGEYGAGVVYVWDEGEWLPPENFEQDFKKGDFKFALNGQRVRGVFAMVRLKENEKQPNWLLIKEKDKFAVSGNLSGIENFKTSVKTGKTADEINAKENLLLQKNQSKPCNFSKQNPRKR